MSSEPGRGPGKVAAAIVWLAVAAALVAFTMAAVSAPGRGIPAPAVPVTPGTIRQSLLQSGFVAVNNLRQRGAMYTAEGTTPSGDSVQIVISGATGAILGAKVQDRPPVPDRRDIVRR